MGDPLENNFVKSIIENNDMSEKNSVPQVHQVGMLYAQNLENKLLPPELDPGEKLLVFIIRMVHMLGIGFLTIGWVLPRRYLIWHVLFCIKSLLMWEICDDKCYMSLIVTKLFGFKKYQDFVPANMQICKAMVIISLGLSVQSMLFPQNSYYNILKSFVDQIGKFYK